MNIPATYDEEHANEVADFTLELFDEDTPRGRMVGIYGANGAKDAIKKARKLGLIEEGDEWNLFEGDIATKWVCDDNTIL